MTSPASANNQLCVNVKFHRQLTAVRVTSVDISVASVISIPRFCGKITNKLPMHSAIFKDFD